MFSIISFNVDSSFHVQYRILIFSKTRGEMYATVGECGEIEFAPNILFTTLHELLLRIHGITCQKPIRIWKDTFQK